MKDTVLTDTDIAKAMDRAARVQDQRIFPVRLARAIESVVLQSPEVVALRKDAKRYRWLDKQKGVWAAIGDELNLPGEPDGCKTMSESIDAAMEAES